MKSAHTKFTHKTTARKSQQRKATVGVRGLARVAECQPSENNLRLLSIFDPLEKSSGNLQVFKRTTRGASAPWTGWNSEVGNRKSEGRSQEAGGGREKNRECDLSGNLGKRGNVPEKPGNARWQDCQGNVVILAKTRINNHTYNIYNITISIQLQVC
jgi:hypothetical protein